jgi:hypothetical protein
MCCARCCWQAGLDVFKDDASLRSGDRWLERLQQAVGNCGAFVVLVGRDGVQRWVGAEVEVALVRHLSSRSEDRALCLPIHPILLGDTPAETLPPFLGLFQAERWAPGAELPAGLRDALLQGLQRLDTEPQFEGCPFLGLSAFGRDHASLFFGRRVETLEALSRLGDQTGSSPERLHGSRAAGPRYSRWLEIAGHSGSGKSSLVHAGLLPMVERGSLLPRTGYARWRVLGPMKPGRRRVDRLAEALEHGLLDDAARRDMTAVANRLASDARALAGRLRDFKTDDTAFLLFVDQFEELYTLADDAQRKAFDRALACALDDDDCPLFIVSTLRSDFLDRIADELPRSFAIYRNRCAQQVVANLLHHLTFAAHREQHLDEHGAKQLLRSDRGSTCVGVDRVEQALQSTQRFIDQCAYRAQRVVSADEVLELGRRVNRTSCIASAPRITPVPYSR